MTEALLILSIGPVQGFIAQARRAADLYAGSQLLARLISAAIDTIGEENILYPRRTETKHPQSLPNKLIARVPNNQAQALAQAAEQKIREKWQQIAEPVREWLDGYAAADEEWQQMWKAQLKQLPEIYWTVTPWPERQSYKQVYKQAGRDFDARKRLRNFDPIEEWGRKCTVCGERAALYRAGEKARDYWAAVARNVDEAKLRPTGKEQLCAVCAVKRFGKLKQEQFPSVGEVGSDELSLPEFGKLKQEQFPSVSEMAAVPFKQAILEYLQGDGIDLNNHDHLVSMLEQLTQTLALLGIPPISKDVVPALVTMLENCVWKETGKKLLCYDGEWFFPETYERKLAEVGASSPQVKAIRQAQQLARDLSRVARDLNLTPSRPSPYYALLVADGDRMGKQIRDAANEKTEQHIAISQALAEFAGKAVYHIIEGKHAGRVVYAGGDDVLALLPLPTALAAAEELRQAYTAQMTGLLKTPTMSAGIAVAHHLSPLGEVLNAARQAEHAAKEGYNRNAIVVAFHKRGGAPVTMGAGWEFGNDSWTTIKLLLDIQQRFAAADDRNEKERGLSLGLAHTLLDEARFLGGDVPVEARQAEVERLLYRAGPARLPKEIRQKQAKDLARRLIQLAGAIEECRKKANERRRKKSCQPDKPAEAEPEPGLVTVARWLLLMRFIVQEAS